MRPGQVVARPSWLRDQGGQEAQRLASEPRTGSGVRMGVCPVPEPSCPTSHTGQFARGQVEG